MIEYPESRELKSWDSKNPESQIPGVSKNESGIFRIYRDFHIPIKIPEISEFLNPDPESRIDAVIVSINWK